MRIACVGAGPAGLYLAILMKQRDTNNEVRVFERNPAGVTYGWGVVFWDDLLGNLRDNDPQTARDIFDRSFRWVDQVLHIKGGQRVRGRGTGFSIRRQQLLNVLAKRATDLGVEIQFEREIADPALLPDADVIVASDGVGSQLRRLYADRFKTQIVVGRNKYVWLGTTRVFDAFTFGFVPTDAGWIWFHAYGFDRETSTLIVECSPETWTDLGFDRLGAGDSLALLESIFEQHLIGHRLIRPVREENGLPWLNFRTVTNEKWHADNIALVGDAAHTTHFSIGSGTRLAIRDAIALATNLHDQRDVRAALEAYGKERQPALVRSQREARLSAQWFENVPRYIDLEAPRFFALLQDRRSSLIPRMPPLVYYQLHKATQDVAMLRKLRRWAGRRAEGLYGRRCYRDEEAG